MAYLEGGSLVAFFLGPATVALAWPLHQELPLVRRYRSQLDSTVADMTNLGGPNAGSITAATLTSASTCRPGSVIVRAIDSLERLTRTLVEQRARIANVIDNAVKYARDGGEIAVRLSRSPGGMSKRSS